MDTSVKPGQTGRGRRRRWSGDQKLTLLQEGQTRGAVGRGLLEVCGECRADVPLEAQP